MYLEAVLRNAIADPDMPAFVTAERQVTRATFQAEFTAIADRLVREGLAPGDVVGISVKDEYLNLTATLAAMFAGLSQVALPTHDPLEYRRNIATRLRVVAVLADNPQHGLPDARTIVLGADDAAAKAAAMEPASRATGGIAYITSSGTTGSAKLIPLTQARLYHQSVGFQPAPRRQVFYRPASVEFNASRRHRLYALACGSTNILIDPERSPIDETCHRFGVTQVGLSAAQVRRWLDRKPERASLPEGTEVRLGGSAINPQLRSEIVARLTPLLYVTYGASEVGSIATCGPGDHVLHPATVGRVHGGVTVEVADDADQSLPANVSGKIRVKGPGVAAGYHDAGGSEEAFRDGWFYPGDVGHFGDAGDLRFDGRGDDMMVLASINIFPAEIERVVEGIPGVIECAAFSRPSGAFGDIPLVAVVTDGSVTEEKILPIARQALGLRAPRKVFVVDSLPRNRQGKIARGELAALAGGSTDGNRGGDVDPIT